MNKEILFEDIKCGNLSGYCTGCFYPFMGKKGGI